MLTVVMTGLWNGHNGATSVDKPVVQPENQSRSRQLPRRPHTSLDEYSSNTASSPSWNVLEGTSSSLHGATRRQTSTSASESTQQSSLSIWQYVWQNSLQRLRHSRGGDKRAPATGDQSATSHSRQPGQPRTDRSRPTRSSSAQGLPYTESAIDVEFTAPAVPLHRPVPLRPTKSSATPSTSPQTPEMVRRGTVTGGESPKSTLKRIGRMFKRSKSANNSREPSPAGWTHSSPRLGRDRKDIDDKLDSKDVKDNKSAKKKLLFRKKSENIPLQTLKDNSSSNHPVPPSPVSSTGSQLDLKRHVSTDELPSTPVKSGAASVPSTPTTSSGPGARQRFGSQSSSDDRLSSQTPSTPVKTELTTSGPSTPVQRHVTSNTMTTGTPVFSNLFSNQLEL